MWIQAGPTVEGVARDTGAHLKKAGQAAGERAEEMWRNAGPALQEAGVHVEGAWRSAGPALAGAAKDVGKQLEKAGPAIQGLTREAEQARKRVASLFGGR